MKTLLIFFAGAALLSSAGMITIDDAAPSPAPLDLGALFEVDTLQLDLADVDTDLGAREPDGDDDTRIAAGSGVDVEAAAALHASLAP